METNIEKEQNKNEYMTPNEWCDSVTENVVFTSYLPPVLTPLTALSLTASSDF